LEFSNDYSANIPARIQAILAGVIHRLQLAYTVRHVMRTRY